MIPSSQHPFDECLVNYYWIN